VNLEQKTGQLFVVAARGRFLNERSNEYRELLRQVAENHVGGVIWFASTVLAAAWLNDCLQRAAKTPLLVSADLEAGMGMRFTDATFWPPAMAVAAAGDLALAEEQARITAREARTAGINHILAPVADVNVDPGNPVINTRSFGEEAHRVAEFVTATVRGIQSEGCLATAKHFPGHGDTRVDSHRSLPVLDVTRERLDRVELVPFRAAIEAGVASVMIGHLAVPAIDGAVAPVRTEFENAYGTEWKEIPAAAAMPASVSKAVISDLLRGNLGFKGLVVTDAFDMGGLAAHFDPGEAAVRAIEAGEDQILYSADTDAALRAVREAVRSGRIPLSRIDESVDRILEAKKQYPPQPVSFEEIARVVDAPEHIAVAEEVARRSIRIIRDDRGLLPLSPKDATVVVVNDFVEENPVAEAARLLGPSPRFIGPLQDGRDIDGRVIVMLLVTRPRSGAGRIALPEAARRLAERLGPKTIAISFGSPYVLGEIPWVSTFVCAWGIQPLLQRAAVTAVTGRR
jgi:beta-N-acetylhexosaminidase